MADVAVGTRLAPSRKPGEPINASLFSICEMENPSKVVADERLTCGLER